MFWPLRTQGTDTEESGVRGGGGGVERCCCPNREKISAKKMQPFIHGLSVSGASEDFLSEPKDLAFCM
jgi:hypothetical protein